MENACELKASTYGIYLVYYRKHILGSEIGKKNLNDLKTDDLQRYYNRMQNEGLSAKTIRHLSVIINEALNQAVRMDKIKMNVNSAVVLPKKAKFTGEVLSKEDVVKLTTEAKGESLYPLVMLTIFTGMRKGEVLGLTWDNVHWEGRYLEVKKSLCRVVDHMDEQGKMSTKLELMEPKNKSSIRKIPLNDLAFDILHTHYERQLEQKAEWQEIYTDRNLLTSLLNC